MCVLNARPHVYVCGCTCVHKLHRAMYYCLLQIWLYTNELHGAVAHVSVGICCLAILSLAVAKTEQDLCNFLIERLPSKLSTLLSNILKWL